MLLTFRPAALVPPGFVVERVVDDAAWTRITPQPQRPSPPGQDKPP